MKTFARSVEEMWEIINDEELHTEEWVKKYGDKRSGEIIFSRIRHQTLQEVRERMPKKIKIKDDVNSDIFTMEKLAQYNQALSDIHQLLKEMENETL